MGRVDAQPSAGLEAERAVLGAMLIDESIVSQVLARWTSATLPAQPTG